MNYVIFDDLCRENFFPITLTRSIGDLRVGILKLRHRINAYFENDENNIIISRDLEKIYRERHTNWKVNRLDTGNVILINSRIKISDDLVFKIRSLKEDTCLSDGISILAASVKVKKMEIVSENIDDIFSDLKKIDIQGDLFWKNIWELISENSKFIGSDFQDFFYEKDNYYETELGITVLNPYNVWIGDNTVIKPGVVIDASKGPVVIDEDVTIMPNAVLIGPAFIGKKSIIKCGAKIYGGTSIGPVCRIGGELEGSIIQAYSNKQHDGFLGHSYIGEWVNLGADTNNSDLKNNYKSVKAYYFPQKSKIDTGYKFIGAVIADHVKTAINSTINTGSVIGVGCNLFGKEIISDFTPSFKWGDSSDLQDYQMENFLETAVIVKARRGLTLSKAESDLFHNIRELG